ncbi:MAG: DPP IV N-terminal domain-containing protein [Akkermansiaceae bacterium]
MPARPLLTFVLTALFASAEKLTLEAIYTSPGLSGPSLRSPEFSPDNKLVTYLQNRTDDQKRYDLWAYDLTTKKHARLVNSDDLLQGEEVLSDEEKDRRERMRIDASGIISYQWDHAGESLLFPLGGDLYYYTLASKKSKQLTQTDSFELDARFSPDGKKVAFIREQNLVLLDLASGKETMLTTDGKGAIKNAMAEFVAQEEMDRHTGYWWAPDSESIAYIQFDESPVTEIQRNEIYADRIKIINQRYPYTGGKNVTLKLGIVGLADQKTKWLDLGKETDIYLPRVQWGNTSNLLTYQWQSRDQQELELRAYDRQSGKTSVLVKESSQTWINLHKDLCFLADGSFLWTSERSGFKHIYHLINGKTKALTSGDWQIHEIESVDEKNGYLYFTGWVISPTERHLYRVPLDGSAAADAELLVKVTTRPGWHGITFSDDGAHYIDHYSNLQQPTQISLHQSDGTHLEFLLENKLEEGHPLFPYLKGWIRSASGTLPARDGTQLHFRYYRPRTPMPEEGFPVIVYLYGGPHVGQQVRNAWSRNHLWAQYLLQKGYAVFTLDNRGSPNRGKKFEDVIYKKLAQNELYDQLAGVNWLKQQKWTDNKRFGIHGHSYGGYMTLMAMFRLGNTFAAGVSGAPVTDFRLYDTHYTERYLSTPQKNSDGYETSSVFPYISGLQGDLLIMHGMADDNVLFKNTTKLVRQLQDEGKLFEFMAYPGEKHGISSERARLHMMKTMADFFDRKIGSPR